LDRLHLAEIKSLEKLSSATGNQMASSLDILSEIEMKFNQKLP
jgi:hypothetical protein